MILGTPENSAIQKSSVIIIIIYFDLSAAVRVSGMRGVPGWFPVCGAEQRFCASRRIQTERLQRELPRQEN